MDRLEARKQTIEEVNKIFRENHMWAEAIPHETIGCVIQVEVNGDWKHDHDRTDHIMKEHHCSKIGEIPLDPDTGDDTGHSMHNFIFDPDD